MVGEGRHFPQRVTLDSADLAEGCSRRCKFNLDKKKKFQTSHKFFLSYRRVTMAFCHISFQGTVTVEMGTWQDSALLGTKFFSSPSLIVHNSPELTKPLCVW